MSLNVFGDSKSKVCFLLAISRAESGIDSLSLESCSFLFSRSSFDFEACPCLEGGVELMSNAKLDSLRVKVGSLGFWGLNF